MPMNSNIPFQALATVPLQSPLNSMLRVQGLRRSQQEEQLNAMRMDEYRQNRADAPRLAAQQNAQEFLKEAVPMLAKLPPEQRPGAFAQVLAYGQQSGESMDGIPQSYDQISRIVDAAAMPDPMNAYESNRTTETSRHNLEMERAANKPPQFQPRAPVMVVDPVTGKPTYVDPGDSYGRQAYVNPSSGQSFDERLALKGLRRIEGGGQEIIQGSLADPAVQAKQQTVKLSAKDLAQRESKYPKATAALNASTRDLDALIEKVDELAIHPGLSGITGTVYGRTPNVTNESTGAQAVLDAIRAAGAIAKITELRQNSPTGGALGNVSDRDIVLLKDAAATLAQSQGTPEFKRHLADYKRLLEQTKTDISEAYTLDYEYRNTGELPDSALEAPGGAPPEGISAEEWAQATPEERALWAQ